MQPNFENLLMTKIGSYSRGKSFKVKINKIFNNTIVALHAFSAVVCEKTCMYSLRICLIGMHAV
jgi:hypothetical protein